MVTGKSITGIWMDEFAHIEYRIDVEWTDAYGHPYWMVSPNGWAGRGFEWRDMHQWCEKTFGPTGTVWSDEPQRWFANSGSFWFSREQDKDWFILRWR